MKTFDKLVTPEYAEELLRSNTSNRTLSKKAVERMVEAMKHDDWKHNGETIKIGKSGRLLDGQHRLTAVIQAQVSCRMLICEGVEDDVIDTIDIGKRRTFGDWLNINGESHCSTLSAALHKLAVYEKYYANSQYVSGRTGNLKMRYEQLESLLDDNRDIRRSVERVARNDARHLFDRSTLAVMHYLFAKADPQKADEFFNSLSTGANLQDKHPILVLRQKGLHWKANNTKPELYEVMMFFIRSWNAYINDKTIEHLRCNTAESFPEVMGHVDPKQHKLPLKQAPKKKRA